MGRCWTGYASIVGRTRPLPLSRGEGVEGSSSHATTTYHCWVGLCVLKMPLGKYVDRLQGGAECEAQGPRDGLAPMGRGQCAQPPLDHFNPVCLVPQRLPQALVQGLALCLGHGAARGEGLGEIVTGVIEIQD